jgi:hypothetical protein
MEDQPLARWAWEVAKVAVPLVPIGVVLTNAAGLWETEHQEATRLRREAEAEEARRTPRTAASATSTGRTSGATWTGISSGSRGMHNPGRSNHPCSA